MSVLSDLKTPIFYAEGMPEEIDLDNFQLKVAGLIEENPLTFSFKEIENMPFTSANARLTSVSGWSVRAIWQGVRFLDFIKYVKLKPEATYANFRSYGNYTTCVSLNELMKNNVLLCYKVNDEYLELEYGSPLRMVIPHLWGYKSIKSLIEINFTDRPIPGFWETRGYSDDAHIQPGKTLDINSGDVKAIKGGEITDF